MTIKITTTKELGNKINLLVYGDSGTGKTYLIKTAPNPIIISSEHKALSLAEEEIPDLPMWLVNSEADIKEAITWLKAEDCPYETACIDSISDIAEMILAERKRETANGRQAYGDMSDKMYEIISMFTKELPDINLYVIAKSIRMEDARTNIPTWRPSMPGNALNGKRDIVYSFDISCALRIGVTEENEIFRYLQTEPDGQYYAKGLSSKLDSMEEADLTKLFNKILGE